MYGDSDIWGYTLLNEIDEAGLSYEFNILGVFRKDGTNDLFWATDSGCSCPSPWERRGESDLSPIVKDTYDEFERAVNDFPATLDDRRRLIEYVRDVLSGQWTR